MSELELIKVIFTEGIPGFDFRKSKKYLFELPDTKKIMFCASGQFLKHTASFLLS